MTIGLSVILSEAKTTQKASVAKMSSLIFITEPRSRGYAPSSEVLPLRHPDAEGGRIQ